MAITEESYQKWLNDRELRKAKLLLGDSTIDENYINQYSINASKFLTDSANNYSNIKWGQSQAAFNAYNNEATKLKYQKVLIQDWLLKNSEPGSYTDFENYLNNLESDISELGAGYSDLNKTMSKYASEEEYNNAVDYQQKLSYDPSEFFTADVKKLNDLNKIIEYYSGVGQIYDEKFFSEYLFKTQGYAPTDKSRLKAIYDSEKQKLDLYVSERNKLLSKLGFANELEFKSAYDKETDYKNAALKVQGENIWYKLASDDAEYESFINSAKEKGEIDKFFEESRYGYDDQMTGREKEMLYYLDKKQGEGLADSFYSSVIENIRIRRSEEIVDKFRDFAEKNPVTAIKSSALSIPAKIIAGVLDATSNIVEFGHGLYSNKNIWTQKDSGQDRIDIYDPISTFARGVSAAAEGARNSIVGDSKVGGVVYDTIYGVLDNTARLGTAMLITGATGGSATVICAALASIPAGNETLVEAKAKGLSDEQALLLGITAGVAEYITEKWSIENILGDYDSKIGQVLKSFASESSEEAASAVINNIADLLIAGEKSDFKQRMYSYINDDGLTEYQAFVKALYDDLSDIGYQALIGGLSGALMGGGRISIDKFTGKGTKAKINEEIIKKFKETGEILSGASTADINALLTYAKDLSVIQSATDIARINEIAAVDTETLGKIYTAIGNSDISTVKSIIAEIAKNSAQPIDVDALEKVCNEIYSRDDSGIQRIAELTRGLNAETIDSITLGQIYTAVDSIISDSFSKVNTETGVQRLLDNISNITNSKFVQCMAFESYMESFYRLVVDNGNKNGYNSVRGESYVANVFGGIRESSKGSQKKSEADDSREESQVRRAWAEDAESFVRRTQSDKNERGRGKRVYVKHGKSAISYIPASADGSVGSATVDILTRLGIKAVLCNGSIEANSGKMTIVHFEALTMPDGTVYVSNDAKLSAIQSAAHEAVHVYDYKGDPAYTQYESVICDNMLWGSDTYNELSQRINNEHYNGSYDIDSAEFASRFIREISAYINQFVSIDISRAEELFSDMFRNWDAVVEASKQFNKDIGADFSESASFMSENESVLPDVSAADGETDSYEAFTKRYNGTLELTEDQKLIQSICKALGNEAVFENLDRWVTGKDGKRRFFSPDGYFDKATGKIYINTSTNGKHNPLMFVIKHELTHFGELNKSAYDSFVKAVKKSKEFKAWLKYKTGMEDETTDRMAAKLGADIRDERSKYGVELGVAESEQEVIANFAGEILFAKSGKTLDSLLNSVEAKQRPKVIQAVVDFFRWLREKLSGNKDLTFELQRLESKYTDMLKGAQKAAENTNSTGEGGMEYSAAAASADVLDLVQKVKSGNFKANEKIYFDDVSDELATKIEKLTGITVKGFKVAIEARQIEHILKDHGENGKSDHSMSSDEDIAKMEYVLKNPDGLSLSGKTQAYSYMKNGHNKTADTVLYDKAIGNKTYYVVQAVPDTKAKTLYVVSAFIGEKGYKKEASQLINAKSPDATAKPGSVVTSNNRVAQNEPSVNSNSMQETREYSFSEDVDTEQGTDYTAEFDKLTEQFEKGDITRAEFIEQVKALYTQAGETYGTIPKGETVTGNENFDNPTPKKVNSNKKVRQFARTIIEGGELTEEMLSVTKQQILSGDLSYTPTSNEQNLATANREIEGGHADALWMKTVDCEEAPNATTIATGEALLKLAFDRKDTVKAVQLTAELCEVGTRTAQALQAFSLLKRMDGIGQLYYVQRAVNTLNHDLKTRFKDKAPDIKINETLAEQLAESKTEEDFAISYTAIMNDIAAQVPSTFLDKWNAWRYMAMLANPLTHFRNIWGNLIFVPKVKLKDVIAAGLEHASLRGDKADKRTKSVIISKEYKQFAKDDYKNVEEIITGSGKMNPKRGIADNRPIFSNKVLESIRKFSFNLLEKEDAIFLKKHYTRALGGYLQAKNVNVKNVPSDTLAKAREYAILEAQKATFRDANKLADAISRFSNTNLIANIFVEGNLPFKKTPLNIARRGVEYSSIGLIKTLSKGSYDLKKGNISASQFIDGIAGGLTGTGIMLVGAILSSLGIVVGGFGDDDEDWFEKLLGRQEYSIEFFGMSYTIDWAAPACIPFFIGVAINESMESEGNDAWWANLSKAMLAGLEPIINLSMLSGIQETIASARYADGDEIIYSVVGNIIGSYFSQALPTVGGKIANTLDDTRRTNYIDKSSKTPIWVQSALNTVKAKVPGLSMTRPEYVDAWGETQDKGNLALRIFQNFLSPGYVSSVEVTDIDNELKRLAGETGEQSVFPDTAEKKVKFKNYTKNFSADEYVEYATMKGQMSADYINELIHSAGYGNLTDEQKVEVIKNLYALANAKAKSRLSYTYDELNAMHGGKITKEMYNKYNDSTKRAVAEEYFLDSYKKPINIESNGGSAVDYYISQAKKKK